MREVWLDEVFLINAAADLTALAGTGRLCRAKLRPARLAAGVLLGSLYACAAAVFGGALASLPVKLAVGGLMALAVFGGEARLWRASAVFIAVSAAMAGLAVGTAAALGESGGPSPRALAVTEILTLAGLAALFRISAARSGRIRKMELSFRGRTAELSALADTGNALRDPLSGESVPVAEAARIAALLPPEAASSLGGEQSPAEKMQRLFIQAPYLRCRLLPYSAVGVASGMLLAVRLDEVKIDGRSLRGGWVALSPTRLSETGEYDALVGGDQ
ncbi:MAG: sigma-E processing peptidase SpoIIGA [Oscillospiraceae bacterium]|nr:sigma-E processing peptidase SpoIIGA [Oscillospiraceae bacterium]